MPLGIACADQHGYDFSYPFTAQGSSRKIGGHAEEQNGAMVPAGQNRRHFGQGNIGRIDDKIGQFPAGCGEKQFQNHYGLGSVSLYHDVGQVKLSDPIALMFRRVNGNHLARCTCSFFCLMQA